MERHLVVFHKFRPSLKARYVRIHPKSWYSYIAMRVELYGCRLGKSNMFIGSLQNTFAVKKGNRKLKMEFKRELKGAGDLNWELKMELRRKKKVQSKGNSIGN